MSNIIKFPKDIARPAVPEQVQQQAAPAIPATPAKPPGGGFLAFLVKFVWVVTVLLWPILKWVLALATSFQFIRMLCYWNTPGVYAGWTFLAYFAALTGLTYYVSIYRPQGF